MFSPEQFHLTSCTFLATSCRESSVTVDQETCEYTASIKFNAQDAGITLPGNPPVDCSLEVESCKDHNGNPMSCLFEQRNIHRFDEDFADATGFHHVGIDVSPCGHPPFGIFTRPHLNLHVFYETPEERVARTCDMLGPFICNFPGGPGEGPVQSTVTGRGYYVESRDIETGKLANMPATFRSDYPGGVGGPPSYDHAVPGEGLHAWDHTRVMHQDNWTEPLLIMGSHDGEIKFWEPMFPIEFSTGDQDSLYEEDVEYVAQTIKALPANWKMEYKAATGVTTLTLKGTANNCVPSNEMSL